MEKETVGGIPYKAFKQAPLEGMKDLGNGVIFTDNDGKWSWEYPIPNGGIAQSVEHLPEEQSVVGSIPTPTT